MQTSFVVAFDTSEKLTFFAKYSMLGIFPAGNL